MKIEVGFDYLGEKNLPNFNRYKRKVASIDKMIKERSGLGNDYLGWLDYPLSVETSLLDDIVLTANEYRKKYDTLVVCGIGGSYLGSKASIDALRGLKSSDSMEIIYLGNSLDPNYVSEILDYLNKRNFAVCVISKSGTTTETSVSFRLLKEKLKEKYGDDYRNRIVAVTDETNGALRKEVNNEGYKAYVLPGDIGGRYSVMTPVGLFPLAAAGIDIKAFIKGMNEARGDFDNGDILTNPCYQYALVRYYLHTRKKYKVEMFNVYEPRLSGVSEWFKQLFDESEGKDGKALLVSSCTFTTDLHSLGQFIQEGNKILFETILYVKHPNNDIVIKEDKDNLDGLNYLSGKSLSFINQKAYLGTLKAHYENGNVPNITLTLDKMDATNLGYLYYFFMKACAMSAYLLNVNPFNQPGVEVSKKNMFHLLGKEGY